MWATMELQAKFTYCKYILVMFNDVTVQFRIHFVYKAVTVLFGELPGPVCAASVGT